MCSMFRKCTSFLRTALIGSDDLSYPRVAGSSFFNKGNSREILCGKLRSSPHSEIKVVFHLYMYLHFAEQSYEHHKLECIINFTLLKTEEVVIIQVQRVMIIQVQRIIFQKTCTNRCTLRDKYMTVIYGQA